MNGHDVGCSCMACSIAIPGHDVGCSCMLCNPVERFTFDDRGAGPRSSRDATPRSCYVYLDGQLVGSVADAGGDRKIQMIHVVRKPARDTGLRLLTTVRCSREEALEMLAEAM